MPQPIMSRCALKIAFPGRCIPVWTAALLVLAIHASADNGHYRLSPHGSVSDGVHRISTAPRGSCAQCHTSHDGSGAWPYGLFRENSTALCMTVSMGGCHADQPTGGSQGYPAQETDRMPYGSPDPGYFEYNSGGTRIPGLSNHTRWPGQAVWQNSMFSPHYTDPDMPIRDVDNTGSCDNCHSVHGGPSRFDMLDTVYSGIAGSQYGALPENYALCLSCHSQSGPIGMNESGKFIADYYDRAINPGENAGHAVSSGGGYVPMGARLPCSDCHNPHGSQGNANGGGNAYLLSDQRPGWYGLTAIRTDNAQVRRFCFGCHQSSDYQGGGTVEGLVLAPLPGVPSAHQFNHPKHCYDCHGSDYTTPTSNNVHNPGSAGQQ